VDANGERFLEQKVVSPCDAPSASEGWGRFHSLPTRGELDARRHGSTGTRTN